MFSFFLSLKILDFCYNNIFDVCFTSLDEMKTEHPSIIYLQCNYVIPAFCIVVILLIFQIPAYVSPNNLPAVVGLFLLYG